MEERRSQKARRQPRSKPSLPPAKKLSQQTPETRAAARCSLEAAPFKPQSRPAMGVMDSSCSGVTWLDSSVVSSSLFWSKASSEWRVSKTRGGKGVIKQEPRNDGVRAGPQHLILLRERKDGVRQFAGTRRWILLVATWKDPVTWAFRREDLCMTNLINNG